MTRTRTLLAAIACLLLLPCAAAQEMDRFNERAHIKRTGPLYTVAGTVTDAMSGEPLPDTDMALFTSPEEQLVESIVSDDAGHFQFPPLPAGKYSLVALRRGYAVQTFNQHGNYGSAIVTGPGQDTEHLSFRFTPPANLRIVVTDDAGDPVEGANVLIAREDREAGLGMTLSKEYSGQTDSDGLLNYWGTKDGTYLVAVKAEPWFAMHPSLAEQAKYGDEKTRADMAALDVAYPVTYYGGVTQEDQATPLEIKGGEQLTLPISLHAVPALHITLPKNAGRVLSQLRQAVLGDEDFGGINFSESGDENENSPTVEFSGIAPGEYTLVAGNREIPISATGNLSVDTRTGTGTVSVNIHAGMANGSPLPANTQIALVSANPVRRNLVNVDDKGNAKVDSVTPGEWYVVANSNTATLAVVSIQPGVAAAKKDARVQVKDRAMTVNVLLAQGKTAVQGFAQKDGKNLAGVMMVLVPENVDAHVSDTRRDQTDSDGSFNLQRAAPGKYVVVAIENGWGLDYGKADVIGPYLKNGVAVTIPVENNPAIIKLDRPVPVQPKQ